MRFPHISNFTDLDALAVEPSVALRLVDRGSALGRPDLLILPGTKTTVADLDWLRQCGLASAIEALAAEPGGRTTILGICGGYQMLGLGIEDAVESRTAAARRPVSACCPPRRSSTRTRCCAGPAGRALGVPVRGYEIRHGRTASAAPWIATDGPEGAEGCRADGGRIAGTSLHGLLEGDDFRSAFLAAVARRAGSGLGSERGVVCRRPPDPLRSPGHRPGRAPGPGRPAAPDRRGRAFAFRPAIPAGPNHRGGDPVILYLTNAPSEILALRSLVEGLPDGFPPVRAAHATGSDRPDLDGAEVVLVRLLGGSGAWAEPFADLGRRCRAAGIPLLAFGGEAAPDAQLTAASTVPSATVAQAFEYLVHGGLANLEHLLRFVSDTVGMTGFGFDPPAEVPATGVYYRTAAPTGPGPKRTSPAWRSSSTGPTWSPGTPASWTTSVPPWRPRAPR